MASCASGSCDDVSCCSRRPPTASVAASSTCPRHPPNISYFLVAEGGAHDEYSPAAVAALIRVTLAYDAQPATAAAGDDTKTGVERDLLFFLKPAFCHNDVEILDDNDDIDEEHKGEKRRRVVSAQTFNDMWYLELMKNPDEPRKIFIGCSSYDKPRAPLFKSCSR